MKSGKHNFLEPSGPLQACDRTALRLPLLILCLKYYKGIEFATTEEICSYLLLKKVFRLPMKLFRLLHEDILVSYEVTKRGAIQHYYVKLC